MIIIFIYHNFIVLYKLQYWKHSCMFYVCDTCRYVTVGSCLYSWSGLHWLYWFNDTRTMFLFFKKNPQLIFGFWWREDGSWWLVIDAVIMYGLHFSGKMAQHSQPRHHGKASSLTKCVKEYQANMILLFTFSVQFIISNL